MEWTEQQARAVTSRGKNLIVSAGAGSGKTAVMLERICTLIEEGADLRRMAVCTFTNAAAADMRRKLALRLSAKIKENPSPALVRALGELSGADISTLHAWCSHIVKARFFDVGVSPEFTIAEEGEARALKGEAAQEAIEEAKSTGNADFAKLYAAFSRGRTSRTLTDAALAVYDFALAQPNFDKWLSRSAQLSDSEYRAELYEPLDAKIQSLITRATELAVRMGAARFTLDDTALAELADCMKRGEPCTARTPMLRQGKGDEELHGLFKELKSEYAEICKKREKIAAMPSHESSAPLVSAMAELVKAIDAKYADAKREKAKLDYSDLERLTYRILCGKHRDEVVGNYDYVFVDEYQDINPLQEEILSKFGCNMFFVGDVKQSIYGFRMCRPKYFTEKFDDYSGKASSQTSGEALQLTRNFRSGENILDFVNGVFERVMTENFGGVDYSAAKFESGRSLPSQVTATYVREAEEKEQREPKVYSVTADLGGGENAELEAETDAVVREIQELLESEVPDGTNDDGTPAYRKAQYSDIAVLVRSRGKFTSLLEKKLRAASLPVASEPEGGAEDSFRSVAALASLLRLLDNARDDVNLAAVMLSPVFGNFTQEELAELRAGSTGAFCDCLPPAENTAGDLFSDCVYGEAGTAAEKLPLSDKAKKFAARVEELRLCAQSLSVSDLAGMITARFGCFNYALSVGGEREAAALDAYLEHLASVREYDSLHGYLRYIDRVGMPRLVIPAGGNAINVMTIHASKGLEFPFVIMPELHKRFNLSDSYASVICDEKEGIVLRTYDFEGRSIDVSPRFAYCAEKSRRASREEELRILYVGMTRAECKLSFFSREPKEDNVRAHDDSLAYIDWLAPFLSGNAKVIDAGEKSDTQPKSQPAEKEAREPDGELVKLLCERFASRERYGHGAVKVSVSGVIKDDDGRENTDTVTMFAGEVSGGDDRAAERGSAAHKFMQYARFGQAGEFDRLSEKFAEEAKLLDKAEMEEAFGRMHEFIAGRRFYREKAFVISVPAATADAAARDERGKTFDEVLVQGVIDLLIEDGDGKYIVVDYKTGERSHMSRPSYARQLGWYAYAVQRALSAVVKETYLYSFSAREFINIRPIDVDSVKNI